MHLCACRRRLEITGKKEGQKEGRAGCAETSGFVWPVCADETWQRWRQRAGGHVLGDELIHNNLPTPLLYKCIQTHTHVQKKQKKQHSFPTTHTLAVPTNPPLPPPAPTAFSDLHLVLESAGTGVGPGRPAPSRHLGRVHATFNVGLCSFPLM